MNKRHLMQYAQCSTSSALEISVDAQTRVASVIIRNGNSSCAIDIPPATLLGLATALEGIVLK